MANSISAELTALRADISEVLSYLRQPSDDQSDPTDIELQEVATEETGVKLVDGQLVDVPKDKGK